MTEGYAIKQHGEIDVRTVSPTERAAKVNWLVVDRNMLITNSARDDQIERAWEHLHKEGFAECVRVKIEEIQP
jgi:hypothetical protein